MTAEISAIRKAAVVLRCLDRPELDRVLECFSPELAQRLLAERDGLQNVPPEEQQRVLEEVAQLAGQSPIEPTGEAMLVGPSPAPSPSAATPPRLETVGRDAQQCLTQAEEVADPFQVLCGLPTEQMQELLRPERPRVVALVLSHLPTDQAARVLELLPAEQQPEVIRHLCGHESISVELVRDVARRLTERLRTLRAGQAEHDRSSQVARLLKLTEPRVAGHILGALEQQDPELARDIRHHRQQFEDLAGLERSRLRRILMSVEPEVLAFALKGASPRLQKRCFDLLPEALARHFRTQLDGLGPLRISDIEAAQDEVLVRWSDGELSSPPAMAEYS